jgi:hypothetical protein
VSRHSAKDRAWMRLRALKLKSNPLCEHEGCGQPAVTVHHMQTQAERPDLRYVMTNLQALCRRHSLRVHGKRSRRQVVDLTTGWAEWE